MTPEAAMAEAAAASAASASVTVGPNASLTDVGNFQASMQAAAAQGGTGPDAIDPALKGVMDTLQHINTQAQDLSAIAESAAASDNEMTPGEMIMLTVRCHEFLFNTQLTSNIANRTSDGLQQLFRQQS